MVRGSFFGMVVYLEDEEWLPAGHARFPKA